MKAAPLSLSIFKFVAYTAKEKQQIENRKAETKAIRLAQEAEQRAKEAEAEAEDDEDWDDDWDEDDEEGVEFIYKR